MSFVDTIRADFPALHQDVNGSPLVYLDNAATSQKPWQVINALTQFYENDNANVHRGIHTLSDRATRGYEGTRDKLKDFLNAAHREEIIFTRGMTEAANLIAQCFVRPNLRPGDAVVISEVEHHSNIIPWQMLASLGLEIRWIPVDENGNLQIEVLPQLLDGKVKLVSVNIISNSIGSENPVESIIEMAHDEGIPVLLDACQAPIHMALDVQALNCDFCVFSGHKMLGPTGTGVLYGKRGHLEAMEPWLGGGDMIDRVTFEGFTLNDLPYKFEAGTPNIADFVALGAAVDYLNALDRSELQQHEQHLLSIATEGLSNIPGVRIIGQSEKKTSILSFVVEGDLHPADIGTLLDQKGIAIRAGHHCTMPLLKKWGLAATARASFAFYNTESEAQTFIEAMDHMIKRFN